MFFKKFIVLMTTAKTIFLQRCGKMQFFSKVNFALLSPRYLFFMLRFWVLGCTFYLISLFIFFFILIHPYLYLFLLYPLCSFYYYLYTLILLSSSAFKYIYIYIFYISSAVFLKHIARNCGACMMALGENFWNIKAGN